MVTVTHAEGVDPALLNEKLQKWSKASGKPVQLLNADGSPVESKA
jgi:hypothetical protein